MPEYTERDILVARIRDLEAENFKLSAGLCHDGYGDESGNWRCKYQDRIKELEGQLANALRDPLDVYESKPWKSDTADELRRLANEHHDRERLRIAEEVLGPRVLELEEALRPFTELIGERALANPILPDMSCLPLDVEVGDLRRACEIYHKGEKP